VTEGLELIKRLWTEDSVTHHGRYFQLDDAKVSVRPKQSPRPFIWLGGDCRAGRAQSRASTPESAQIARELAVETPALSDRLSTASSARRAADHATAC
jgi:alkanesulfonate monooxygenase SsuD/methylene tetrahydromethanopterin reductase-like flavin-dependent oxidoreductase (luciferase family)